MSTLREKRLEWLRKTAQERILLLDGAWGVMIQGYHLHEADFRGACFHDHKHDLKGNNDLLVLTRPDVVRDIGRAYLDAGADIIETNSFNSTSISQADYGLENTVSELNETAARVAREVCDAVSTPERPRFVAGVLGPHQPHRIAFARCERSQLSQRHVRRSARRPMRMRRAA